MQSSLPEEISLFPIPDAACGPLTAAKQSRFLIGYAALSLIGCALILMPGEAPQTFGLGLLFPGLGFLPAITGQGDAMALMLLVVGLIAFGLSLVIWFATGNVILPCATWLGLALLAIWTAPAAGSENVLWLPPVLLTGILCHQTFQTWRLPRKRRALNQALRAYQPDTTPPTPQADALTDADLAALRLLLDRALQPVETFNGFDQLDQFQTAALRYQLNFTSYALSAVQAAHLPAFAGYMAEAQSKLKAKQAAPRVWRYWKLENSWGNLDRNGDPFARDNIMYSGFVAAQLLYHQKAVGYPLDEDALRMTCISDRGVRYSYTIHEIIETLVAQYARASYGLLPCEPNWVFPLCNAITATAIRAYDAAYGTAHWPRIAPAFRQHLEAEFIDPNGRFLPFRSSYTGFAPPAIGGAVLQSFPCLFFNAVFPDIARRQWAALQIARAGRDWRAVIWPVDVGNYRFTRAAGYAATAAAAGEMGDAAAARALQDQLARDLPLCLANGIAHRPGASIWAHANEMLARVLRRDSLRHLVTAPLPPQTPYLASAPYPDVLVAKARWQDGGLALILVPTKPGSEVTLTVAGLAPRTRCRLSAPAPAELLSDASGEVSFSVTLTGRTSLTLTPAKPVGLSTKEAAQ